MISDIPFNGKTFCTLSESEPRSTTKLINMQKAQKALATRWPSSRHLPSGHLPQASQRAHPKHAPQYHDYQLPDHLYISLRITSINAPMPVNSYNHSALCFHITTLIINDYEIVWMFLWRVLYWPTASTWSSKGSHWKSMTADPFCRYGTPVSGSRPWFFAWKTHTIQNTLRFPIPTWGGHLIVKVRVSGVMNN